MQHESFSVTYQVRLFYRIAHSAAVVFYLPTQTKTILVRSELPPTINKALSAAHYNMLFFRDNNLPNTKSGAVSVRKIAPGQPREIIVYWLLHIV